MESSLFRLDGVEAMGADIFTLLSSLRQSTFATNSAGVGTNSRQKKGAKLFLVDD
jgi:hypothetical protein